ncbi:MAG TPA: MmcQ/YjbR family DNA-binding protein [Longimicrobiaceae bacterium]|nr:MmcQ/YjbR family DNA-binding protein [Longimicrobiaceae bacterium]
MTFQQLRDFCLSLPDAEETFPFGEDTLVFKVGGKMFAITGIERLPLSVSLKCDPDRAVALRERYAAVQPGYHLNKTHWNTVELDGSVPDHSVRQWIRDSYDLVAQGRKGERGRKPRS